ncbi:MAG TPA: thiamine pyrophosphate-binding protein [Xanthobacteraceae bacterium]|nr:thiamine pyrophosphate-binding protein [Xanthobacteraceae bacterium]
MISGAKLLADALLRQGVDTMFFIMGAPTHEAGNAIISNGIRLIDVRHEQAGAMMAHAYARLRARPGVCMGASGPGTINLTTGLANALVDCAPVVALGGAAPVAHYGMGAFQDIDQIAIMRPVTKWAERVYDARRIPHYVAMAFAQAMAGKPGPVYLDLPGDVLAQEVDESEVRWPRKPTSDLVLRAAAPHDDIVRLRDMLAAAERPLVLTGSGILYSQAAAEVEQLVNMTGIPIYTTPQGRGVVPEDHEFFYGAARSTALKEADFLLVVGTRLNYVFSFGRPPAFSPTARFVRIDIDPEEIGASTRIDLGIVADARTALQQLLAIIPDVVTPERYSAWRQRLSGIDSERQIAAEGRLSTSQIPIHPLRLCKEVRDHLDRDAILVVDGQEILNFGRQSIPSFKPGHRLNSGTFGTMGVGLPFGVGAKAARPDAQVVVLHGDGSFGLNALELDTAIRHHLPVLVVISLNGGWTGDPEKSKPGRDLGYTRFDKMAAALGCHGEYVEHPDEIRPALERASEAVSRGQTAVVNVVTDWRARADMRAFRGART